MPEHMVEMNDKMFVKFLRCHAEWTLADFQTAVGSLAELFNKARRTSDIVKAYHLDKTEYRLDLYPHRFPLISTPKSQINGPHVQVCFGEVKTVESAGRKLRSMDSRRPAETGGRPIVHLELGSSATIEALMTMSRADLLLMGSSGAAGTDGRPAALHARSLTDMLRCTCTFEDPFVLALFYAALSKAVIIRRVKKQVQRRAQRLSSHSYERRYRDAGGPSHGGSAAHAARFPSPEEGPAQDLRDLSCEVHLRPDGPCVQAASVGDDCAKSAGSDEGGGR